MRLRILSDLHRETSPGWALPSLADGPSFDVAVLAGDVAPGLERGIDWAVRNFPDHPVIYVVGDLELRAGDALTEIEKGRRLAAGTNIILLHDDAVTLNSADGKVTFLGATLWTGFDLFGERVVRTAMAAARSRMSIFRAVRMDFYLRHVAPADMRGWHKRSAAFIRTRLRQPREGKTVVLTHHPGHALLGPAVDPKSGFAEPPPAGDERWLDAAEHNVALPIFGNGVDLVVSGHIHSSIDTHVGGTRVVANPKGHGPWSGDGPPENERFDPYFTVEI